MYSPSPLPPPVPPPTDGPNTRLRISKGLEPLSGSIAPPGGYYHQRHQGEQPPPQQGMAYPSPEELGGWSMSEGEWREWTQITGASGGIGGDEGPTFEYDYNHPGGGASTSQLPYAIPSDPYTSSTPTHSHSNEVYYALDPSLPLPFGYEQYFDASAYPPTPLQHEHDHLSYLPGGGAPFEPFTPQQQYSTYDAHAHARDPRRDFSTSSIIDHGPSLGEEDESPTRGAQLPQFEIEVREQRRLTKQEWLRMGGFDDSPPRPKERELPHPPAPSSSRRAVDEPLQSYTFPEVASSVVAAAGGSAASGSRRKAAAPIVKPVAVHSEPSSSTSGFIYSTKSLIYTPTEEARPPSPSPTPTPSRAPPSTPAMGTRKRQGAPSSTTKRARPAPYPTSATTASAPLPVISLPPQTPAAANPTLADAQACFSYLPLPNLPSTLPPPHSGKKSHQRKQSINHIPRPRNAFILFRSHAVGAKLIPPELGLVDHKNISKVIGQIWKGLSSEEKAVWEQMAENEKKMHAEKFPDYRYRPKKREDREREKRVAEEEKERVKLEDGEEKKSRPRKTSPKKKGKGKAKEEVEEGEKDLEVPEAVERRVERWVEDVDLEVFRAPVENSEPTKPKYGTRLAAKKVSEMVVKEELDEGCGSFSVGLDVSPEKEEAPERTTFVIPAQPQRPNALPPTPASSTSPFHPPTAAPTPSPPPPFDDFKTTSSPPVMPHRPRTSHHSHSLPSPYARPSPTHSHSSPASSNSTGTPFRHSRLARRSLGANSDAGSSPLRMSLGSGGLPFPTPATAPVGGGGAFGESPTTRGSRMQKDQWEAMRELGVGGSGHPAPFAQGASRAFVGRLESGAEKFKWDNPDPFGTDEKSRAMKFDNSSLMLGEGPDRKWSMGTWELRKPSGVREVLSRQLEEDEARLGEEEGGEEEGEGFDFFAGFGDEFDYLRKDGGGGSGHAAPPPTPASAAPSDIFSPRPSVSSHRGSTSVSALASFSLASGAAGGSDDLELQTTSTDAAHFGGIDMFAAPINALGGGVGLGISLGGVEEEDGEDEGNSWSE